MASLIFHYSPEETTLHRLDPRVKMSILMAASAALFAAEGRGLGLLAPAVPALLAAGRISPFRVFRAAFPLFCLAALVFVCRAFLTPGAPPAQVFGWPLPLSKKGLVLGLEEALRLVIVIFLCHAFICVTPAADIQRAASFFAGKKAALLMRLSFAMIPELLDTGAEILAALSCRGLSFGRHPLRGLALFTSAFTRKAAARASRTAEALEARCCGYRRTSRPFSPGPADAVALFLSAGILAASLLL
ncbi:MAG: energy-coupling factor transporter transmembrane protein EcfT [Spirochaetia bacterium]|jgi:energy-coupling factor transporter transmembrane protein EcfT|nr:energy-coupling factor transporter transmembrane protein EcfT [Spirochaetia bacterium]